MSIYLCIYLSVYLYLPTYIVGEVKNYVIIRDHDTQSGQISQKQDERNICVYMSSCAQVHDLPQSHCGDNGEGTLFS